MTTDYYEFTIASHYLPALINADATGLDDEELAELDTFESDALENAIRAGWHHWHWAGCDDAGLSRCEVSGLLGDCVNVRLVCFDTVRDMVGAA